MKITKDPKNYDFRCLTFLFSNMFGYSRDFDGHSMSTWAQGSFIDLGELAFIQEGQIVHGITIDQFWALHLIIPHFEAIQNPDVRLQYSQTLGPRVGGAIFVFSMTQSVSTYTKNQSP